MKKEILSKIVFAFFFIFSAGSASMNAGTPANFSWNKIESTQSAGFQKRSWVPQHYSLFSINPSSFKKYLSGAPLETNNAARSSHDFTITLPLPDGSFHSYTLVE